MSDFSENVQYALSHIGDCIASRRIANGQRQQDLAAKAGESVARVSNLENGKDCKLSLLLSVLETTGMLEEFLDALPVEKAEGRRVRISTGSSIETTAPLNKSKFISIINRHPDAELPVNTRTAYLLRDSGFALRKGQMENIGEVFIATTVENAKTSAYEWEHIDGRLGGFKPLTVTIPQSLLSEGLIAEHQMNPRSLAKAMEVALSDYKVSVTVELSKSGKAIAITSGKEKITASVVFDIVNRTISEMEAAID